MSISDSAIHFLRWGVTAIIVAAVVLIGLRTLFNYMDLNPFSWSAVTVRRLTDPIIAPISEMIMIRRRSILSASTPAIGEKITRGNIPARKINAKSVAELVR